MNLITRAHLLCKCCNQGNPHTNLVLALNQLQALAQAQLDIHSGCRCEKHNTQERGALKSQHLLGKAADIHVPGLTPLELYLLAEQVPFLWQGGIGLYPEPYIHIDVREYRARWYREGNLELPISTYVTHAR